MKYCIVSDDDGHNYIIEASKKDDFYKWLDAVTKYWEDGNYDEPEPNFEYIESINGSISLVTFDSYKIR